MKKEKPETTEEWLEKISGQLDEIKKNQNKPKPIELTDLGYIDEDDYIRIFKISKRTAQMQRAEGKLRFIRRGGRIYYKLSDIIDTMEEGFKRK